MVFIAWTSTLLSVIILVYLLQQLLRTNKNKKLPPGPKGLPILGHLHMLGKNPHQDLYHIAKKHGPIMLMRFGFVPTIVASSPHAAELFLKTHDLNFASRPYHEGSIYIGYEQRNLTFSKYGPYWRNIRKLCTLELLSNLKINQFRSMRMEELGFLVKSLKEVAGGAAAVVDISARVAALSTNMTCLMTLGRKYSDKDLDEKGFKAVIKEIMNVGATPNLGDYFPFLGVLDLQGLTRRMKILGKIFDGFLEKIIDDHVLSKVQKQTKDFVDIMMEIIASGEAEFEFDQRNMKAVLLDMILAGMDTSAASIEWVLSALLKHPQVLKTLQKELETVVGMNRMIDESDLESLKYLDMVIKEALRLHPVAPLLIPHEAIDDCIVDGFHIPKKSRIIINTWAIGRDPNAWPDPEKFQPERFIGSNIDLRGRDFQLLPFGSGRRGCPGLQLGLTVVRLVVAQLVHCFDWELPDNMLPSDLDMTEAFGLVTTRANHLMAIPTYRLHI